MWTVIANFVPGFRRIRTSLVIGYFWIVLVWLVVRPNLPDPTQATGALKSIYEVAETVGKFGVILASAVPALLIGTLSVVLPMMLLSALPVPRDVRLVFLRRMELDGRRPAYTNFRAEQTRPYVLHGILPAELYRDPKLPDVFGRLCAEAEFRWSAPVPIFLIALYLTIVHSPWWAIALPIVPVLMIDGRNRFVRACRMLTQASLIQANQMHHQATQAWDEKNGRVRNLASAG